MTASGLTPVRLTVRLVLYFIVVFGSFIALFAIWPETLQYMPLGGHDALDRVGSQPDDLLSQMSRTGPERDFEVTETQVPPAGRLTSAAFFLALHLGGTILLMIPITWTYMATRRDIGYHKNFARALIVLPICATTIVLLIQDSLALAFGLAALVAAVRFRVALDEAIDGIYVFAAICVGLAAGIGFLGVGAVMTVFFCFASVILWSLEYGANPLDEAKQERKRAKLSRAAEQASPEL